MHPLRYIRVALNSISQRDFARQFGVSTAYVQSIEGYRRYLSRDFAVEIMLRLGIDSDSLLFERGRPRSVIETNSAEFTFFLEDGESKEDAFKNLVVLAHLADKKERLKRCIGFWRERVVPSMESETPLALLQEKVDMLFDAARCEGKHVELAMRLDRWLEASMIKFRLKTAFAVTKHSRFRGDVAAQPFLESLTDNFKLV